MNSLADLKRFLASPVLCGLLLAVTLPVGLHAQTPGSLDSAYANPETDQPVQVVIAQTVNGATKAIIGGSFSSLPNFGNLAVPGFVRFNADGTPDTDFLFNVSGTTLSNVTALALQPDGKLLVAGHAGGKSVLLRFGADGTPDTAFHVTLDDDVESIAFQSGGNILISGLFNVVNGTSNQRCLARLSPAGVLDTTFQAYTNNALTILEVKRIALLSSGGLLAVTHVSEGSVDYLIQLDPTDGSVPSTPAFFDLINDGRIYDMTVDSTGRVIVVGNFDGINNKHRDYPIARFAANGQLDNNFVGGPPLASVLLQSVVVDANNQPLVGGVSFFTSVLFRLTSDVGVVDSTFSFPLGNEGNYIQSLALEPAANGAVLAAGQFSVQQRALNLVRVVTDTTGGGTTGPTSNSVTVAVPGTSNLWLAGAAAGTTASTGQDNLTNATPFLVSGLTITPGAALTFTASGNVSNDPANPVTVGPDGGPYLGSTIYSHIVENGVGSIVAPINSLIGVFLDASTPSGTPPDGLDFSGSGTPADGTNYATLAPALRQPFFIGDGKTAAGVAQNITVPAGATRLYLGSLDPSDQENNLGLFQVAITSGAGTGTNPGSGTITSPLTAAATVGQSFTYQITASGLTATSFVASGLPTGLTVNASTGAISGTPMAAPATYPVMLTASDATGTAATATLSLVLQAAPTGPVLAVNPDDFTYSVKGQPNTGNVVPGDQITFSLTVRNIGTAPATNVVVKASFDSTNTKLIANNPISNGGTAAANVITWTLPKLNNGDHQILTYTVKVKTGVDTQSGIISGSRPFSATAAAPATAADLSNVHAIALTLVPPFNLSIADTGASTVAGSALTYTFTVVNRGANTVSNVTADVHLPIGYTKSNFGTATLIDDNGNPSGPAYKLGADLGNGQFDPSAVRVYLPNLAAGASQRFTVVINVPSKALPGSTIDLQSVNLNGTTDAGPVSFAKNDYMTTISKDAPAAPPSLLLLKLTPTASNLTTFLAAAKDPTNIFYKPAQQFFLALALYENKLPTDLEAMSADQLAALLNPYVTRDTDPDTGDSIFDVPSPNAKQPNPYVTYLLVYVNVGASDAAGITIEDSIAPKFQLDRSSVTFKGAADVKSNLVGADGRGLTFTFGKVKHGTGGLIIYKADVPAPGDGPNLGDVIPPITAVLTVDSLSGQTFYTPAESLLVTGAANAIVDSSQADVGDGTTNYTIFYKNTGGQKSKDFIVVSQVPTGGAFQSADFLDIGQNVIPGSIYPDGTKHISDTQYIEPISYNATSGRVAFHLGKIKPRAQGFVRVTYKVTDAALALKPAGLVHHYYVAGGSFPGSTSAMPAGRPVPKWARHDEETRLHRQGGDPRFSFGDIIGIFKQGFDNVTHAVASFFAKPGTPQPAGVAPTLWVQRIAPMAVAENTDFNYIVTVGNSGAQPAYNVGLAVYVPQGATYKSSNGGTPTAIGTVIFGGLDSLPAGQTKTFTLTFHTTALAGSTVTSADCLFSGFGDSAFNYQTGQQHVGPVSSLVYSADQARNFAALQTSIATNAAQAGNIDPSTLTANPKFAAHAAAITANSIQTTIAHADYYTLTNGLTLVAQGGGNLVAQGGGNVLASGPSNLVAQGGGNLVAQGGGNLVAQGGGNLTFNNIPGFGATVTASALFSQAGVAKLVAQGGGNLVAQGGGNLVAQGGGNIFDLSGTSFATSTLANVNTLVAGQGNQQSLGVVSNDGGSLIGNDGGGLISEDGGGVVSNDGGSLKFVGGAAALIGNDGGGFHHTSALGGERRITRASSVKPGTLLGSPANSVSLDFNNAGGMVFGVGGSRANGQ